MRNLKLKIPFKRNVVATELSLFLVSLINDKSTTYSIESSKKIAKMTQTSSHRWLLVMKRVYVTKTKKSVSSWKQRQINLDIKIHLKNVLGTRQGMGDKLWFDTKLDGKILNCFWLLLTRLSFPTHLTLPTYSPATFFGP